MTVLWQERIGEAMHETGPDYPDSDDLHFISSMSRKSADVIVGEDGISDGPTAI